MRDPSNVDVQGLVAAFDVVDTGKRTLQVEVYERMCAALMEGRLRPGQRISIRNLAGAMNTSPMPIREAVKRLEAIHVIELNPGRVITVAKLSAPELKEIRDIRISLEGLAGRSATVQISAREIVALTRMAHDMHRQWESDNGHRPHAAGKQRIPLRNLSGSAATNSLDDDKDPLDSGCTIFLRDLS